MKKIDTTSWRQFCIEDLFDVIKGKRLTKADRINGDINYIGASIFDNGITAKIGNSEYIHPAGTITVCYNCSDIGTAFYQEEPFWATDDVNVLYPKFKITPNIAHFLCPIIHRAGQKYTYEDKWTVEKMRKTIIKLPAKNESPVWQYMEDYMHSIEQRVQSAISAIKDTKQSRLKIDTTYWKEFRVGDLFEIHPTKAYKLINHQLFDEGIVPVVVNSAYNNGIGGYTTNKATEHGGMITFSDTVDANTIFYQDKDFVGYPHVQGLYPIGSYATLWNAYRLRFFASIFRKTALAKSFDYGNKFRRDIAIELKIKLPATPVGDPDWHYMEMYMRGVEAIVKNKLSLLVPHKQEIALHDAATVNFNNANVTYIDKSTNYNIKK